MLNGVRSESSVHVQMRKRQSFALHDDSAYTANTRIKNKEECAIIANASSHAVLTRMSMQLDPDFAVKIRT